MQRLAIQKWRIKAACRVPIRNLECGVVGHVLELAHHALLFPPRTVGDLVLNVRKQSLDLCIRWGKEGRKVEMEIKLLQKWGDTDGTRMAQR